MQQDEAEDAAARSEDGEEMQAFKLPLTEENVALGRLGRIYKALDTKTWVGPEFRDLLSAFGLVLIIAAVVVEYSQWNVSMW